MTKFLKKKLNELKKDGAVDSRIYRKGNMLYINGACQILSQSNRAWEFLVDDENKEIETRIIREEEELKYELNGKTAPWDAYGIASLMQMVEDLERFEERPVSQGKAYTREGMIKRVLAEREEKAKRANYRITFADNIYGEHTLINEKGVEYKITLRDFENETGYINNADLKTNKLGTTKHLIFAFRKLKSQPELMDRMGKQYPFVEIYADPLADYQITWHYPHEMEPETKSLIKKYFGVRSYLPEEEVAGFLDFLEEAEAYPQIKIRPEVEEKVREAWDKKMLEQIKEEKEVDYSRLKMELFPYQKKGAEFAAYRDGAIIADEMGLGKTIQAIAAAVFKKQLFDFEKTLIICPASLKEQWKQEIEKFCDEEAVVVNGKPKERQELYKSTNAFFVILNYELVLRDLPDLNKMGADYIILDEAQRIKNFTTVTANTIKRLHRKHALVITGTPIENRLIDLYSIMSFVDPKFLAPLWEFSYKHCYFDETKRDKITGYYNLQELNERLKPVLIRRERQKVVDELPSVTELNVPVELHPDQRSYHSDYASGVGAILRKKYMTPYDHKRLMSLLNGMRMACDSTYLIDKETHHSSKLHELKYILIEKLDIRNSDSKIIIFSEWVTMLQLVGKMLQEEEIGFARLTGNVAVKNRDKLIKKFETDPNCKVFLSTEAGGSGLNLQVADTVINFELPWNPAKKNQRVGRINRLGQKKKKLTVINLISQSSIEMKIASGLNLKQNLFDGVLNEESGLDVVDFSAKGKAQFLKQLEEAMDEIAGSRSPDEMQEEMDYERDEKEEKTLEDLIEEDEPREEATPDEQPQPTLKAKQDRAEEIEEVMNKGMEFFSGLLKMTTGKETALENRRMEVDKDTGEVVMRFKIPDF